MRIGSGVASRIRSAQLDEIVILAVRDAGAAQKERNGPQTLVIVDLAAAFVFEDSDGAMADVIVELLERPSTMRGTSDQGPRWLSTASRTRARKNGCHRLASL